MINRVGTDLDLQPIWLNQRPLLCAVPHGTNRRMIGAIQNDVSIAFQNLEILAYEEIS